MKLFGKRISTKKQLNSDKPVTKDSKEKGSFVITGLKSGGSSWSLGNSHIQKFSFADALTRCGTT